MFWLALQIQCSIDTDTFIDSCHSSQCNTQDWGAVESTGAQPATARACADQSCWLFVHCQVELLKIESGWNDGDILKKWSRAGLSNNSCIRLARRLRTAQESVRSLWRNCLFSAESVAFTTCYWSQRAPQMPDCGMTFFNTLLAIQLLCVLEVSVVGRLASRSTLEANWL